MIAQELWDGEEGMNQLGTVRKAQLHVSGRGAAAATIVNAVMPTHANTYHHACSRALKYRGALCDIAGTHPAE